MGATQQIGLARCLPGRVSVRGCFGVSCIELATIVLILSATPATSAFAASPPSLQLAYNISSHRQQPRVTTEAQSAVTDNYPAEAPLRLEYQILNRVVRMNQTATELRAVLEAMPGPASPPVPPPARHQPAAPPPTYRSTVEETLARIAHLEILINELGTIIRAMPDVTPPRRTVTTPMQPAIASSVAATGMLQRERDWAFASIIALLFVSAAWWLYRRWHKASDNITPHALSHHPSLVDGINVAPPPQKTATVIPEAQDLPLPVHVTSESTSAPRPAASHVAQESPAVDIPLTYEAPSPGATELSSSVPRPATEQIVAAGNDQALELAEIMVSMGLTEGAAQTLVEQIQANPKRALLHWLKLLEIYQKSGMKDQFENSARELQTKFNIQATDWKTQRSAGKSATLEDYGRIMAKVQELWPKPECVEFLAGLLEDNRGGTRAGFPQPVAEEILLLLSVLQND